MKVCYVHLRIGQNETQSSILPIKITGRERMLAVRVSWHPPPSWGGPLTRLRALLCSFLWSPCFSASAPIERLWRLPPAHAPEPGSHPFSSCECRGASPLPCLHLASLLFLLLRDSSVKALPYPAFTFCLSHLPFLTHFASCRSSAISPPRPFQVWHTAEIAPRLCPPTLLDICGPQP